MGVLPPPLDIQDLCKIFEVSPVAMFKHDLVSSLKTSGTLLGDDATRVVMRGFGS